MRRLIRRFSMKKVPLVDLDTFIKSKSDPDACSAVAEAFHMYGCLIVRDPRVTFEDNARFIDLMEAYFIKRALHYYKTGQLLDYYPDQGYETGLTPENTEKARPHPEFISKLAPEHQPLSPKEPVFDAKWRYMFPLGKPRKSQRYRELDPTHTNPYDFPEFSNIMTKWGDQLLTTVNTVSEMSAVGLGLPNDFFTKKIEGAHNILAPTASDLVKNEKGAILAGFHYDFNFLTIHGKARFPGLYIWLRTGEKIPVSVPDGCLILQSGRQFEIVTGGYISRGMHEVIYDDAVAKRVEEEHAKGKKDIWRISSTLFAHFASDEILEPSGKFNTEEARLKYPAVSSYDMKEEELKAINLLNK